MPLVKRPSLPPLYRYASVGTVCDLLCQLTLFVAFMVLDQRRRAARRCALCPLLQLRPTAAPPPPDAALSLWPRCLSPAPLVRALRAAAAAARRQLTHGACGRAAMLLAYAGLTVGSAFAAAHVKVRRSSAASPLQPPCISAPPASPLDLGGVS